MRTRRPEPHENVPFRRDRSPHVLTVRSVLTALLAVVISIALGYGLTSLVYRFTGKPPEIVVNILSGIVGFLLFGLLGKIVVTIHRNKWLGHRRGFDMRTKLLDETLEALNSIARGDFSVLVPVNERDPFANLAISVNQMAQELGSMEKLRQDFVSNVSHEIQSPLTSISGFAALLRKDALTPEQRAHYLDIIETEAKRLSGLSDNLLKLSSLESQTIAVAPFPLSKQIENAVLMLEPQWSAKNLNLELSLQKIDCEGDEALLPQVWTNLIHNAVKFTPQHGGVTISLERADGQAVCRITDTGPGIASEDQIHIFERFYKADKARDRSLGGNGLGLSLVKKIVELHGGTVSVESEPGCGTAFVVTLPVHEK